MLSSSQAQRSVGHAVIRGALGSIMTQEHPNILLMKQLDPSNIAAARDVVAEDVVWRYFNPNLPDMQDDYVGLDGIRSFFDAVAEKTGGTFEAQPISTTAVGDELVVVQTRNTLTLQDRSIAVDVVTVWRFVDGHIVEVWDIVPGRTAES